MKDRHSEGFQFPQELLDLIAGIASLREPNSAIDPCCERLEPLWRLDFVPSRTALFRNPLAYDEATASYADQSDLSGNGIDIELRDITRTSIDKQVDLVFTVVPFSGWDRSEGKPRRTDMLIANKCLDLLEPGGCAILVVPPNFLTAPIFDPFRRRVLEGMSLDAIVELPRRLILPQASISAAMLVIRNGTPNQGGTLLGLFESGRSADILEAMRSGHGDFFVQPDVLQRRWDRHFHDPQHQQLERQLDNAETRTLEELGEIRRGLHQLRDHYAESGQYLVISPRHVNAANLEPGDRDKFVSEYPEPRFREAILQPGDVLISLVRPSAYVYRDGDPPAVAGMHVAVLRADDNQYIATYLNTSDGREAFQAQAERHARGTTIESLSIRDLREIRVPILPLEQLNTISDQAIGDADAIELDRLRTELLRVKHQLETAEAQLAESRQTSNHHRLVESRLNKILEQQQAMNARMDQVVHVLAGMREQITAIQSSSRSEDERLLQISQQLDNWMESSIAERRTYENYIEIVQSWFDHWDRLDDLTRKFLPSAEHLYDTLAEHEDADFSPFVLQYCRSLENEILAKLFCAYHDHFAKRIAEPASFLREDLDNQKTGKFAKAILRDKRKHTLGDMEWIMQLIKPGGNTLATSPLLQDFREFALKYFDERIAEKKFLTLLRQINEELRIKAAHPYLMNKDLADRCIELVRVALCELLDAYRHDVTPLTSRQP